MTMRGTTARRSRAATVSSPRSFAWDRALVATLRHSTLPWDEQVSPTPLQEITTLGVRDRLSLLAQFAAHEALLQFAGVADGEFDPAEWAVVQKRGSDVRLVRVAAAAADPSTAPPALSLAQHFAERIGAQLDVLKHSWARADAIYAEAQARLSADAAADLRWVRRAGCGEIAAPGPEGLHALLVEHRRFAYRDEECLASVQRFTGAIVLRGSSPLERYSALRGLLTDMSLSSAAAAERILAATAGSTPVFIVAGEEAFDEGSRQVVAILVNAHHGTWLFPRDGEPLPPARWFLVSPRLAARRALEERIASRAWLDQFVESPQFGAYLAHGELPAASAPLPMLGAGPLLHRSSCNAGDAHPAAARDGVSRGVPLSCSPRRARRRRRDVDRRRLVRLRQRRRA